NALTYDASGRVTLLQNANGTNTAATYSAQRGWMNTLITCSGGMPTSNGCTAGVVIQNLSLSHDTEGKLQGITSPFGDESWSYGFGARHRLKNATDTSTGAYSQSFTYDALGNMLTNPRLSGTYGYPAPGTPHPHAVTSAGGNTYSYDAVGNMVSGAGRSFVW